MAFRPVLPILNYGLRSCGDAEAEDERDSQVELVLPPVSAWELRQSTNQEVVIVESVSPMALGQPRHTASLDRRRPRETW